MPDMSNGGPNTLLKYALLREKAARGEIPRCASVTSTGSRCRNAAEDDAGRWCPVHDPARQCMGMSRGRQCGYTAAAGQDYCKKCQKTAPVHPWRRRALEVRGG